MAVVPFIRSICGHVLRRKHHLRCTAIHQTRSYAIFDDDGELARVANFRPGVTFLNKEEDAGIFMDAFSNQGFVLNSGLRIMGPCAVFPRSVLHWNIHGAEDISEASLSLFVMLEPKIDILVLGVGERDDLSKVSPVILPFLRSKKISVEILATDHALATFNFLNSEKRFVAGAFIPPKFVMLHTDDGIDDETFDEKDLYSDPFVDKLLWDDRKQHGELDMIKEAQLKRSKDSAGTLSKDKKKDV